MNRRTAIRWVWIPGICLLGLALWLWLRPRPAVSAAPGLSREEANRRAAAALREIQHNLAPVPAPPPAGEPAIRLRAETIRPGMDFGSVAHLRPSARGYPWLVLFDGPIQPEWQVALENAGATLRAYLPDNAWLVELPAGRREDVRTLPHVAWSGEYRPGHKIQPLLAGLARQHPELPVPVTVQTFAPEDAAEVANWLTAAGASDLRATPATRWGLVRAVLPAGAAAELAALPEVQWIEHHATPRFLNDAARAADRLDVDAVQAGHDLDGTGQIVAIADTGLDTGNTNTLSPDFAGRLLQVFDTGRLTNWSDTYYHGTHVAGSLLGSGAASDGQYRGAAPGAQLVLQSVMNSALGLNLPDDLNDFYRPPYDVGARIHSDSWGSAVAGEYTADSMTTDEFIWDHPDQFVAYAAGNDGLDDDYDGVVDLRSLDAPASAKNVLAVGASESGRPPGGGGMTARTYGSAWRYDYPAQPIYGDLISSSPAGAPQGMAAFSSRGPAADGRTKPDVVAPGTDVVSVRSRASSAVGWGVLGENTNYCFMGGTSMATPLAAGCAALVRQHLVADQELSNPSAALIKAALAGGARSLSPGQYGTDEFREIPELPRPNPIEGWGQIDVAGTLFPGEGRQAALIEGPTALATGASNVLAFVVRSNAPLAAVLAYSDYPSALSAAANLVNDLDLRLVDPAGDTHYPNGLAGPDALNNLESIDVAAAATGRWTLVVAGRNVPQGPQPYSLYLRGAIDLPATIVHEPLETTWVTAGSYLVSAEVTSPGELDPATVKLIWIATGSEHGFTTVAMTPVGDNRYEAAIPAQPVGSRIWYYLSAGPDNLQTFHPAGAPAEFHVFDVTPPLALAVSGLPGNYFDVDPAYGLHVLASNTAVHAVAGFPAAGTNGVRTACIGWQGAGAVPPAGTGTVCDFTMTGPAIISWLWQEQVALTHGSTPPGALAGDVWYARHAVVSTLPAPESHFYDGEAMTFAGWQIDGVRWPTNGGPSRHIAAGISMPSPRTATAVYLDTALDSDANGLPDWFEQRYFGGLGQNRYGDPDGDGYENELEAADHTDPLDDQSVPAVPTIQHVPLSSPSAVPAPWTVAATITDNYQVASAALHWQRNGGLVRSAAMTNAGDLYSAQIPSPARDGDRVVYWLTAEDAAGFSVQSSSWTVDVAYARIVLSPDFLEAALPGESQTNLDLLIQNAGRQPLEVTLEIAPIGFADDMESGTNGWTRPDGNVDWHLSSWNAHSPAFAWYCGQALTQTYRDATHAALVTPPIRLAAGAPRLDFMHRARFEFDSSRSPDGYHYWDSGVMEISDNGGAAWSPLVPEGGYPGLITSNPASPFAPETPCFADTADWDPVGADLSAYAGKEVQIRFRFGADAYVTAEGWRLDDVVVSPRTEYGGWIDLAETNWFYPPGFASAVPVALDTTSLPPMASGHCALLVHHNDPERASPILVPVALHNVTRRVRVTTDGPGAADPSGEFLLGANDPFTVAFAADAGHFIADIRSNAVPLPLPDVVATQSFAWATVASNLDLHAVFMPLLEEGLVPPEWLALYGLTGRNWMAEASLDQDGDGLLTWQESQIGSSPTDAAEAPLMIDFETGQPGTNAWRIVWQAFTNRNFTYSILASTNPAQGGFTVIATVPAAPPVMTSPPLPADHSYFGLRKE